MNNAQLNAQDLKSNAKSRYKARRQKFRQSQIRRLNIAISDDDIKCNNDNTDCNDFNRINQTKIQANADDEISNLQVSISCHNKKLKTQIYCQQQFLNAQVNCRKTSVTPQNTNAQQKQTKKIKKKDVKQKKIQWITNPNKTIKPLILTDLPSCSLTKFSEKPPMQLFNCQNCHKQIPQLLTDIDHRRARFLGGSNYNENLQTLCLECHRIKSSYETQRISPVRNQIATIVNTLIEDDVVGLPRCSNIVDQIMNLLVPNIDIGKAKKLLNCET